MSILLPCQWDTAQPKLTKPRVPTNNAQQKTKSSSSTTNGDIESIFVNALVSAGRCRQHIKEQQRRLQTYTRRPQANGSPCPTTSTNSGTPSRCFSTRTTNSGPAEAAAYHVSREELNSLIDTYDYDSPRDKDAQEESPSWRFAKPIEPPIASAMQPVDNDQMTTEKIYKLQEQLEAEEPHHDQIWHTYLSLPEPRAPRLPPALLRLLFHQLSIVEHKSEGSMLRYFALLEDARQASIPLNHYQWTSAIAFAGRFVKNVSGAELESALTIWRQMENEAGVKGTSVTFNVLFDIATKARKFVLADMIMQEMQARELPLTRFFRTSLIHHHGLRGDGDAVRNAYKELVDAGEIVDSTVITCVIKALLMCGEAVAAEQIFARAKLMHAEKTNAPAQPTSWRKRRQIGRMLDSATGSRKDDAQFRAKGQAIAPLAPQLSTYKALVFHYANDAGDLDRITEILNEMKHWGVDMHGSLYMYLFQGFAKHGGVLYTPWTRRRLEQAWKALVKGVGTEQGVWLDSSAAKEPRYRRSKSSRSAVPTRMFDANPTTARDDSISTESTQPKAGPPNIYPTRNLVLIALRAFLKVAGPERTWDIWAEAQNLWSPPDEDVQHIEERLDEMLPDHDQSDKSCEDQIKGEVDGYLGQEEEEETVEGARRAFGTDTNDA